MSYDPYGHQYRIAQKTLGLSKTGAQVMGGMTHPQAINVLKQHKWSEDRIARYMLRRGHSEGEVLEFFRTARLRNNGGNSSQTRRKTMRRNPGYVHTEVYKGHTINIVPDPDPMNPRTESDNIGVMVCFHKRYDLGDKGHGYKMSDFNSWAGLKAQIINDNNGRLAILPMYMMDHSGLTISTSSESFRAVDSHGWDWGQIGYIFVTFEAMKKAGFKRPTRKQAERIARSEVEAYNAYISGEIYGYEIINPDGSAGDSVWGFDDMKYAISEAKASIG